MCTKTKLGIALALALLILPGCDSIEDQFKGFDPREEVERAAATSKGGARLVHLDLDHGREDILGYPVLMKDGAVYALGSMSPKNEDDYPLETLIAVNAKTGNQTWVYENEFQVDPPEVSDGVVVIGAYPDKELQVQEVPRIPGDRPITSDAKDDAGYDPQIVIALDARDGEVMWKLRTPDDAWLPVSASDKTVFIGTESGKLHALNIKTGKLRWTFSAEDAMGSGVTTHRGQAIFGNDDDHVYAVDLATGKQIWSHRTGFPVQSFPMIAGDTVYVGDEGGRLRLLERATGKLIRTFKGNDSVVSPPVISDGVIYFATEDIYQSDAEPTTVKEYTFQADEEPLTKGYVVAYDMNTGERKWHISAGAGAEWMKIKKGIIYFQASDDSGDSKVYAVRAKDGKTLWASKFKWLVKNDDPKKTYIVDDQTYLRTP